MATRETPSPGVQAPRGEGLTEQVQEQVQEKAHDLTGQASQGLRRQLDSRSTDVGEQIQSLASALRRAAEQLADDEKTLPADAARRAADGVERLGGYLRNGSSDAFLNDVEQFGRKRPWLAGGIGVAVGFAASRFLKASSDRRYGRAQSSRADLDTPLTPERAGHGTGPLGAPPVLPPVEGGLPR
jgi:ElaB/YqjD/DUF883 family membrane-anchored ribosome-binding protein